MKPSDQFDQANGATDLEHRGRASLAMRTAVSGIASCGLFGGICGLVMLLTQPFGVGTAISIGIMISSVLSLASTARFVYWTTYRGYWPPP